MYDTTFHEKYYKFLKENEIKDGELTEDFCRKKSIKLEMMGYQKNVEKLMIGENWRGLLINFGLGSGKTYTALNVAEKINLKVIVILPASLKVIFISELKNNFKKTDVEIKEKYKFISYDSPTFYKQYENIGFERDEKLSNLLDKVGKNNFDNKLIIIDEAHKFFQMVISSEAYQSEKIFNKMYNSTGTKFLFLTGTPIIGNPFEIVPMFNILCGKLPENNTCLGTSYEDFRDNFIDERNNEIKNKRVFMDRITGLAMYYKGIKDTKQNVIPKLEELEIREIIMSDYQFGIYYRARIKEIKHERFMLSFSKKKGVPKSYKRSVGKSMGSFKIETRQFSNLVLPKEDMEKYNKPKLENPEIKQSELTKYRHDLINKSEFAKKLEIYSPKFNEIYKLIVSKPNELGLLFSSFTSLGVRGFSKVLEFNGWKDWEKHGPGKNRFVIFDGHTKDIAGALYETQLPENKEGGLIRLILGTTVIAAGFNFFNLQYIIIMEPLYRIATLKQILGRGVRLCSHYNLPKKNRVVKPYLFLSVVSSKNKINLASDKGLTTDQKIWESSTKLDKLNQSFLEAINSSSVDCQLNIKHNDNVCHICEPTGKPLIIPNLREHISRGSLCLYKGEKTTDKFEEIYHLGKQYLKETKTKKIYIWDGEKYKEIKELYGIL